MEISISIISIINIIANIVICIIINIATYYFYGEEVGFLLPFIVRIWTWECMKIAYNWVGKTYLVFT